MKNYKVIGDIMDTTEEDKDLHKRRKILSVPYEEVLYSIYTLLNAEKVIQHNELPTGYIILSVHHNYEQHAFDFVIAHSSFDEVLPGAVAPQLDSSYLTTQVYEVSPCQQ